MCMYIYIYIYIYCTRRARASDVSTEPCSGTPPPQQHASSGIIRGAWSELFTARGVTLHDSSKEDRREVISAIKERLGRGGGG